jgi:hypothetical protein
MIYSALHVDTTGPNGTSLRPKAADDSSLNYIGERDERHWYIGAAAADQHAEIDLREEPDADVSDLIKSSQMAAALKQGLRKQIDEEVGDIYDLLADQSKMLEMIYAMLTRMSVEYFGGTPIPEHTRLQYLARATAVVQAMDSGQAVLRGSFEDMDAVLGTIIERQSRINAIVRDRYVGKVNEAKEV